MRFSIRGLVAIIGPALLAISLCGSTWRPSIATLHSPAADALMNEGLRLRKAGQFTSASRVFQEAALRAERDGVPRGAAMNWSNAGGAELAHFNFRVALPFLLKARAIAKSSGLRVPYLAATNNLASLYLEMGDDESTVRVAREALNSVDLNQAAAEDRAATNLGAVPKLKYQLAAGLAKLHRFKEAEPIYREAIEGIAQSGDMNATIRALTNFGSDCLEAGRPEDSGTALNEALRLARMHDFNDTANILLHLAKLRALQGDTRSAAALFDAAVVSPRYMTTVWDIYGDRGEFRLHRNDLRGALADFREARRIASRMRAEIVPADRDRITLEGSLSRITAGLIDAGNRLAQQTADPVLPRETFDAAEQDRIWSLRALIPEGNDWRSHLPAAYWDQLARYQATERSLLDHPSPELQGRSAAIDAELQHMEAAAAGEARAQPPVSEESALAHVRHVLGDDSVLLSFHLGTSGGWVWAVDRQTVGVYPIPGSDALERTIAEFTRAARENGPDVMQLGANLYKSLLGAVPPGFLSHRRWLLEPDGPLYDVPFAALAESGHFLVERSQIETIPGALMLEKRRPSADGPFLGIGDPVYSPADPRFHGSRAPHATLLPRLTSTGSEIDACSRQWHAAEKRLLTGAEATPDIVRSAIAARPAVIHFATHIVSDSRPHSSGMIALSLDASGAMQFIGPVEVAALPQSADLVVLNGCHSAAGETLPATGLMGLTRAWIAAGARAVVATRWDIPDEAGAAMMVEFYRAMRARPADGPAYALEQAQSKFLRDNPAQNQNPSVWGAYFLLGRD